VLDSWVLPIPAGGPGATAGLTPRSSDQGGRGSRRARALAADRRVYGSRVGATLVIVSEASEAEVSRRARDVAAGSSRSPCQCHMAVTPVTCRRRAASERGR
jgi:hypothetical protein